VKPLFCSEWGAQNLSNNRARSLYLYLRDNSGVLFHGLSQCWWGFEVCLTCRKICRRIEGFLSGDGECGNTPHHSDLSPDDFAVSVTCTHTRIRVQDEYNIPNPRLPRSERVECHQTINSSQITVPAMRHGTNNEHLRILLAESIILPLNSRATRYAWPLVAGYCVSAGLCSLKPEKRA